MFWLFLAKKKTSTFLYYYRLFCQPDFFFRLSCRVQKRNMKNKRAQIVSHKRVLVILTWIAVQWCHTRKSCRDFDWSIFCYYWNHVSVRIKVLLKTSFCRGKVTCTHTQENVPGPCCSPTNCCATIMLQFSCVHYAIFPCSFSVLEAEHDLQLDSVVSHGE